KHAIIYLKDQEHAGTCNALGGEADGAMGDGAQPEIGDGTNGEDAMSDLAQLARDLGEGKPTGSGGDQEDHHDGIGFADRKVEGKRKERVLGDAFLGFESAESEAGQNEVSLLDD